MIGGPLLLLILTYPIQDIYNNYSIISKKLLLSGAQNSINLHFPFELQVSATSHFVNWNL